MNDHAEAAKQVLRLHLNRRREGEGIPEWVIGASTPERAQDRHHAELLAEAQVHATLAVAVNLEKVHGELIDMLNVLTFRLSPVPEPESYEGTSTHERSA